MTRERERTITVVSSVVTLLGLALYLSISDGPVGLRVRSLLGVDDRLRPPVQAGTSGSYAFLDTQPGTDRPVGFSPCRSIEYVVNPDGAPDDWEPLVDDAITEVEDLTGLDFTYDGTTDDRDFGQRSGTQGSPEPVLIGWSDADEVDSLADDVAGVGGPTTLQIGNRRLYVSGSVVLDTDFTDGLDDALAGDELARGLLLHELGHLVGLDHVDDPGELMYPEGGRRADFGPGDREGLALLGDIPC